jgi:hypothetical protein
MPIHVRGCPVYTARVPLDDALRATFRNYSTLFLFVAAVAVPLHLAHAYAFRHVLAVSDLHPAIEALDRGEFVRSVGPGALARARTSFLVLSLVLPMAKGYFSKSGNQPDGNGR